MRFVTPAEVATLAEVIDPRYRALVRLGAYGGLLPASEDRVSDALDAMAEVVQAAPLRAIR